MYRGIAQLFWRHFRQPIYTLSLILQLALFVYVALLLMNNAGKGLDLTDESYYILSALNPSDTTATLTQYGHYTNLLYTLVGQSITNFRLLGIVILLAISGVFAVTLQRSMVSHGLIIFSQAGANQIKFVAVVTSSLAYYCIWSLTPSYNWLALISSIMVLTGILRATTDCKDYSTTRLIGDALFIGLGGGLAFMAKPTTAMALGVVAIYSLLVLKQDKRYLQLALSSAAISLLFLFGHVIAFEESFSQFVLEYKNGLMLFTTLDAGYGLYDMQFEIAKSLERIPRFTKENMTNGLYAIAVPIPVLYYLKIKIDNTATYNSAVLYYIIAVILVSWLELLFRGKWLGGDNVGTYIAYPMLSFTVIILLLCLIVTVLELDSGNARHKISSLGRLYGYCSILLLVAMAFSLGSNLGLVRRMSFSFVFITPVMLICAQWLDAKLEKTSILNIVSLLLTLTVVLIIKSSMENPQRLPASLEYQAKTSTFYDDTNEIQTDEFTNRYITNLKKIARVGGWEKGNFLIDLTGATPAAAAILNGRALVYPWLIGGYPGSRKFVYLALSLFPEDALQKAWILTASSGRRNVDLSVLEDLNLDFPDSYFQLGSLVTGYREEKQILWKPR